MRWVGGGGPVGKRGQSGDGKPCRSGGAADNCCSRAALGAARGCRGRRLGIAGGAGNVSRPVRPAWAAFDGRLGFGQLADFCHDGLPVCRQAFPKNDWEGRHAACRTAVCGLTKHQDRVGDLTMVAKDSAASDSDNFAQCATYLKALGDPVRLRLVRALQHGPMTVTDLAELLETELPNISHHLRVLFHADLVTIRKDGKFSYYELNREFIANQSVARTLNLGCCKIDLRT